MFACIYSFDDNSFSVLGRNSKKLELQGKFDVQEKVKTVWDRKTYAGIIVKTGDNEDDLTDFGTKAYKKFIKDKPLGSINEKNFPKDVFSFNHKQNLSTKRQPSKTTKLLESEKQKEEFSPKKKKYGKQKPEMVEDKNKKKTGPTKKVAMEKTRLSTSNEMLESDLRSQFEDIHGNNEMATEAHVPTTMDNLSQQAHQEQKNQSTTDSNLTSTWDICMGRTENSICPVPPPAITSFFKAVMTTEVQEYIEAFLKYHENRGNPSDNKTFYRNQVQALPRTTQSEENDYYTNTYTQETFTSVASDTFSLIGSSSDSTCQSYITSPTNTYTQNTEPLVPHTITSLSSTYNLQTDTLAKQMDANMQTSYSKSHTATFQPSTHTKRTDTCEMPTNAHILTSNCPPHTFTPSTNTYNQQTNASAMQTLIMQMDANMQTSYSKSHTATFQPSTHTKRTDTCEMPTNAHILTSNCPPHTFTPSTNTYNQQTNTSAMQTLTMPMDAKLQTPHSESNTATCIFRPNTYTVQLAETIEMQTNAHSLLSPTHNTTEQHDTRNTLTSRDSPSPTPMPPTILSPLSSPSTDSLRRSPRKLSTSRSSQEKMDEVEDDKVRLLASSNLTISRKDLRRATTAADKVNPNKAAFTLTLKLLPSFFSLEVLAQSRGQGLRKTKKTDFRPVLDPNIISEIREYVGVWCQKNRKKMSEADFNDAVTEKISYARKKVKNRQSELAMY